ncbi:MAG: DEAD/DEAH box helicase [Planctomycetota bacterium]
MPPPTLLDVEPVADPTFADLDLPPALLSAIAARGYTDPTPIQAGIIPHVLAGRDVIGQAQTGTGKTAAFALPLLARLDPAVAAPQVLILAPTRELAGQVAETCSAYADHLPHAKVATIYGGAGYRDQLRALRQGATVVVGTPGRVMDHLRRGTLDTGSLRCLVLDEADEMLRMGFIEDVEWILEQLPRDRQMALFSATMPGPIRSIAKRHLDQPVAVRPAAPSTAATTVDQRYWFMRGCDKTEAVARMIEGEDTDGVLVFTRTKAATTEVAAALVARGIQAEVLNGDMAQERREAVVARFRAGQLDVLVATDVAARGLDVPRISHVINRDLPGDPETYIHRIGRTGRAGRSGAAISCVHPRERGFLRTIERRSGQPIAEMELPSAATINRRRGERFAARVLAHAGEDLGQFEQLAASLIAEHGLDPVRAVAAMARLVHGSDELFVEEVSRTSEPREPRRSAGSRREGHGDGVRQQLDRSGLRFRLDVGHVHGARPGMIVGAIANELGLPGHAIGAIRIHDAYTTVVLPEDLDRQLQAQLQRVRVCGRPLRASPIGTGRGAPRRAAGGKRQRR